MVRIQWSIFFFSSFKCRHVGKNLEITLQFLIFNTTGMEITACPPVRDR